MNTPTRVLIVDDQLIVRLGIKVLLEEDTDIAVVGEAANGIEAVELAQSLKPDVILMDLAMPSKDGIVATREICHAVPGAAILVLTNFIDDEKLLGAIQAGARGYLLKDTLARDLTAGVRAVSKGQRVLSGEAGRRLLTKLYELSKPRQPTEPAPPEVVLTARELEVVRLVARGLSNREIGERLSISERTAGVHVSHAKSRLGLTNRTQIAIYALEHGLIEAQDGQAGSVSQ